MDIDPHIEEQVKWEAEKASRRAAWEAQKRQEAELRERQLKQARMEAYLRSRAQSFHDHTGGLPPAYVMEAWQADYVTERAAEQELERQSRLDAAEDVAAG